MSRPTKKEPAVTRGLPANIDAEKFILGSIMIDQQKFAEVSGSILPEHFALEKHRRIFVRMLELHERNEKIDRVTVANELMRYGELESIDGLSYLISLDDGIPNIVNLDSYIKIVRNKASLRDLAITAQGIMNMALEERDDADSLIMQAGESIIKIGDDRLRGDFSTPTNIIQELDGGINAFLDPSREEKGIKTGFEKYDWLTGGMHPGDLILIGARPSMGKTSLLLNILSYVALKLHKPVAAFSLESSRKSFLNRMACSHARVDSQRFRMGMLDDGERRQLRHAVQELLEADIHIDDSGGITTATVRSKLIRLKRKLEREGKELGVAGLDYIQLMKMAGKQENRNQEVSMISRGLKLAAKEIGCPLIALSQLSRGTEQRKGDGRPQLSDLRDSGSLEQDADVVAFIFREEVYRRDREDLRGKAELILAKVREGPIGVVPLVFVNKHTRFENPAEEGIEE